MDRSSRANATRLSRRKRLSASGAGRPRSPAADRAILRAALKLFVERGFDGITVEDVAETAGVARTTVYRRWTSKEALIAKAISAERGEPERAILPGRVSSSGLVDQLLDAASKTLASPNYLRIVARLIGSLPDHPELMSTYWDTYMVPRRKVMRDLIERFQAEGLIRKDADADTLLDLVSGAVMHHMLVRPGRRSDEELRAYIRNVIIELGLKGERDKQAEERN